MIAILGGLGAAIFWATGTLTSSRAGRLIGVGSTVAWMMLVGVIVSLPLLAVSGPLPPLTPTMSVYLVLSGVAGVAGLMCIYSGLRFGKVGVVSAITSTEGAIAAVVSVLAGERLTAGVAVLLCFIALGVAVVAFAAGDTTDDPEDHEQFRNPRKAVALAIAAALFFGVSIFSMAQSGKNLPPVVAVLPVRIVGVAAVFLPLALTGRLRLTRRAAPMVGLIGVTEVVGNSLYVVGGQQSIAVAAVLASQFAAIAAVVAFLLFKERLSLRQRSGIVGIVAGVALLALARS